MKTLFGFGTVMALAMAAVACGSSPQSPSTTLEVTGKVDANLRALDNASAIAIGSDGHRYSAYIQKNGSFRLKLPVGHVYRVIFANGTMTGQHRTIGHLVNTTSNGKLSELAVKAGGQMNLGTVRPAGTSATSLKTACACGSTGSGSGGGGGSSDGASGSEKSGSSDGSGSDKSGSDKSGESGGGESGGSDFETKDNEGSDDSICNDSADVELEAEVQPGDKCAKGASDESAPEPSSKSCNTKDDNHDGKDDGESSSDGSNGSSSSSGGAADSSCHCSKQCSSGSSCVASKCTPDSSAPADTGASSSSSSSGSTPPVH